MSSKKKRQSNIGSMDRSKQVFAWKLTVVVLLIFLQIWLLVGIYGALKEYVFYWRLFALLLSGLVVLYLVNKNENPAYKLIWVILVLTVPLVGGALYIILAGNRTRMKFIEDTLENHMDTFRYMPDDTENLKGIKELSKSAGAQSTYISKSAGYPVYKNTTVKYFAVGEDNYKTLMEELSKAECFIFMEYFIIKQGHMWSSVLEILKKKAKEGVDVRLIYDDFGCSMWLPSRFISEMTEYGIKVAPFNPVMPVINLRQNNRDHRKITVIDGCVGFTGGINLADEYINMDSKFGHWKDTGIMLEGAAVWNLTLMFLQTWKMLTKKEDNYSSFLH